MPKPSGKGEGIVGNRLNIRQKKGVGVGRSNTGDKRVRRVGSKE